MTSGLLRSLRFVRDYRWYAVLGVLAVLAATGADLISPQILRRIIDQGISKSDTKVIFAGALGLVAVAIFGGLASFLQGYFSAKASHGAAYRDAQHDLRQAAAAELRLPRPRADRPAHHPRDLRRRPGARLRRQAGSSRPSRRCSCSCGAVALLLRMNACARAPCRSPWYPRPSLVLAVFVRRLGPMFRGRQQQARRAQHGAAGERRRRPRRAGVRARALRDRRATTWPTAICSSQGLQVRRTVANAFPLLFSSAPSASGFVTWAGAVQIVRRHAHRRRARRLQRATSSCCCSRCSTLGFGAQPIARAGASADRLFEVLDAPEDVAEKPGAAALPRLTGRVEFRDVHLRYPGADARDAVRRDLRRRARHDGGGRRRDRLGQDEHRQPHPPLLRRDRGRGARRRRRRARRDARLAARTDRLRHAGHRAVLGHRPRQHRLRPARRDRRRDHGGGHAPPRPTSSSARCPTATTPASASAASSSPAGSASASRSRARC